MSKSKVVVKEEDKTSEEDWTIEEDWTNVDDIVDDDKSHKTCAACRHNNTPCPDDCLLAPYFHASQPQNFENANKVFGRKYIVELLESLPADPKDYRRQKAMKNLIAEAHLRVDDPVNGCYGLLMKQQQQLNNQAEYISSLNQRNDQLCNLGGGHFYQNRGGYFYQNLGVFIQNIGDPGITNLGVSQGQGSGQTASAAIQALLNAQARGPQVFPRPAPTYKPGQTGRLFTPFHEVGKGKGNQFQRMIASKRDAISG